MKSIKPFDRQGTYVVMDTALFDYLMPIAPATAWKILCYILRRTRGCQKEDADISYREIKVGTGIKSDATISKGIKWLQQEEIIVKFGPATQWISCNYRINRQYEMAVPSTSENEVGSTSKNEVLYICKDKEVKEVKSNKDIKEKEKEKEFKQKEKESFATFLPVNLRESEEFMERWDDWVIYRKKRKNPLNEITVKLQARTLSPWPIDIACAMIDQSIDRTWRGIFELNDYHPLKKRYGGDLVDPGITKGEDLKSA